MDMRAEVWSPLQNTACWLGAWLWGRESTDDLVESLTALGGVQYVGDGAAFAEMLRTLRAHTRGLIDAREREPIINLILSGPGEAPALAAGSASAQAARHSAEGVLMVRTDNRETSVCLVPVRAKVKGVDATLWKVIIESSPQTSSMPLSPGDADAALTAATDESASLIAALGYSTKLLPNPRLTVGALADFYDTPGLPASIPGRAAQLFARADRVAAIIETVTERVGDHSLDPQLFRLWRHIRHARMAGVAYAMSEFAR